MGKWEYKVLPTDPNDYDSERLPRDLNEQGSDGWELVAIYDNAHMGDRRFVFKRPA